MVTLLTGATGFVGSAVLRALLADGVAVRTLCRPGSDRRNLAGLDVEIVDGDLTDPASLKRAVAGCDDLYHVAADYRIWVPDVERMRATNVAGTETLLRLAAAAGASRIVHTSSVAALGLHRNGSPADEATPVSMDDMVGPYKRSKFEADALVRRLAADEGVPVVVVNPSTPIGPRDIKPTPTGRMIVEAMSGRMPAFVDTGLNVVHVDDVAAGHLLAARHGRIGERYILGGENLTLRSILAQIAAITGRPAPRIRLPHTLLMPIAHLAENLTRLTRSHREPFLTVDALRMAKKQMFFSSAKAERDLGYAPRPAGTALRDAVAWFRDNGYGS